MPFGKLRRARTVFIIWRSLVSPTLLFRWCWIRCCNLVLGLELRSGLWLRIGLELVLETILRPSPGTWQLPGRSSSVGVSGLFGAGQVQGRDVSQGPRRTCLQHNALGLNPFICSIASASNRAFFTCGSSEGLPLLEPTGQTGHFLLWDVRGVCPYPSETGSLEGNSELDACNTDAGWHIVQRRLGWHHVTSTEPPLRQNWPVDGKGPLTGWLLQSASPDFGSASLSCASMLRFIIYVASSIVAARKEAWAALAQKASIPTRNLVFSVSGTWGTAVTLGRLSIKGEVSTGSHCIGRGTGTFTQMGTSFGVKFLSQGLATGAGVRRLSVLV